MTRFFSQRTRLSFARYVVDKALAQGVEFDPAAVVAAALEPAAPRRRGEETLIGRLFLRLLDHAGMHTTERCRAYCGMFTDGVPRVCGKPRWHLDSHAYDRLDELEAPGSGAGKPRSWR